MPGVQFTDPSMTMMEGEAAEAEKEMSRLRVEFRVDSSYGGGGGGGDDKEEAAAVLGPTVTVTRERQYRDTFDDGLLYKGEAECSEHLPALPTERLRLGACVWCVRRRCRSVLKVRGVSLDNMACLPPAGGSQPCSAHSLMVSPTTNAAGYTTRVLDAIVFHACVLIEGRPPPIPVARGASRLTEDCFTTLCFRSGKVSRRACSSRVPMALVDAFAQVYFMLVSLECCFCCCRRRARLSETSPPSALQVLRRVGGCPDIRRLDRPLDWIRWELAGGLRSTHVGEATTLAALSVRRRLAF